MHASVQHPPSGTRKPRGHRQSHPTAIQPTSHDPQPQKPHHRKPPHPTHAPAPDALTHHNPNTKPNRSRAGTGPISTRVATDLEPEPDRSRHGLRPISARLGARGWVWQGSCVNLVGGQSGTGQAPAPAILRAGREMSVCRAAVRQASTITSMTAGRGRSLRVTISTRRCSWASGRTSTAG